MAKAGATTAALAALCCALFALAWSSAPAAAQTPSTLLGEREVAANQIIVKQRGSRERVVDVPSGTDLGAALRAARSEPGTRWATPDAIARTAGSSAPHDPGRSGKRNGWKQDQWNFLTPPPPGVACSAASPCGVDAVRAWNLLEAAGRPEGRRPSGARGPKIAVVDTGVAYRSKGRKFARNPDFARGAFAAGRDFIDGDRIPLDRNGHGTHVAATIIERAGNRRAVTGLADGLRLMPVRVLAGDGSGTASDVARGIRWAARKGATVINLSLEFGRGFNDCGGLRSVCRAIRKARSSGALVVAAAGNAGAARAQMPSAVAMAVAGSTIRGCMAEYSSYGKKVDITAPGGGSDDRRGGSQCEPREPGPGIVQLTLRPSFGGPFDRFGYPRYEGSSMAAAHVSAAAALVHASGILRRKLGERPGPRQVERWIECTARPVFDQGEAGRYGAGLLDLAAAVDPSSYCAELQG